MPASQVDWTLPIAVLAVGFIVGLVFVWRQLRAPAQRAAAAVPGAAPLELRDLAGRRDELITQLRELDDTAAKRTPEQLARERYALELEAAGVLRGLDRQAAAQKAAAPVAAPAAAPAPAGAARGFLWGIGTAAVLGALLFYVSQSARPRDAGSGPTGDLPGRPGAEATAAPSADEEAIQAALQRNPDDFDARIALARVNLARQDMMGVWNETQYVLERQPGEPRALAYQALVRLAMGQAEMAVEMLEQALKTAPDLVEGYVHLALVYRRTGRGQDAETVMAEALKRFPEQQAALESVFGQMRRVIADTGPAEKANPHAGIEGAPARGTATAPAHDAGGQPAPPAPPADSGRRVSGVIELDPSLAGQVPAGAVLFIMAREARLQRGAPVAVQRLAVSSFPVRFELGDRDSMAGEPLPDPLRLDVRLDADGDAASRDPADPVASADGLRTGATDVRLVLRRP